MAVPAGGAGRPWVRCSAPAGPRPSVCPARRRSSARRSAASRAQGTPRSVASRGEGRGVPQVARREVATSSVGLAGAKRGPGTAHLCAALSGAVAVTWGGSKWASALSAGWPGRWPRPGL